MLQELPLDTYMKPVRLHRRLQFSRYAKGQRSARHRDVSLRDHSVAGTHMAQFCGAPSWSGTVNGLLVTTPFCSVVVRCSEAWRCDQGTSPATRCSSTSAHARAARTFFMVRP